MQVPVGLALNFHGSEKLCLTILDVNNFNNTNNTIYKFPSPFFNPMNVLQACIHKTFLKSHVISCVVKSNPSRLS